MKIRGAGAYSSSLKFKISIMLLHLIIPSFIGLFGVANSQARPKVPKVDRSYRAMAEIVFVHKDPSGTTEKLQMYIEENYDKIGGRASLFASIDGQHSTIFEDLNTKQAWILQDTEDGTGRECLEFGVRDFDDPSNPLRIYELLGGWEVFPIRQLLNLDDQYVTKWGDKNTSYRNIPSLNFAYVIDSKELDGNQSKFQIESYWSDGSRISPSKYNTVPLGFKVEKLRPVKGSFEQIISQFINLFGFTHDDINEDMFLPVSGISCPGIKSDIPFPNVSSLKSFSFNAEIVDQRYSLKTFLDFWLDGENKILQVEEHVHRSNPSTTVLRGIFTANQGAYYAYAIEGTSLTNKKSEVGSLADFPFYPPYIIANKTVDSFNIEAFFGIDKNKYVRTGTTSERGIPCTVYQALRYDWQQRFFLNGSIWEWCFADGPIVSYPGKGFPLVSLKIYEAKNQSNVFLSFHFYNVKQRDAAYLNTFVFDTKPCYSENHMAPMQFRVGLSSAIEDAIRNETNNVYFDNAWRVAITSASGLKETSLRVSHVRTDIPKRGNPLVVTFTLLNRHPDLPSDIRQKEKELEEVKSTLKNAVDNYGVQIKWKIGEKEITLNATHGTLMPQPVAQTSPPKNLSPNSVLHTIHQVDFLKKSGVFYGSSRTDSEPDDSEPDEPEPKPTFALGGILGASLFVGLALGIVVSYFVLRRK